jgi:hypothetical protein
MTHPLRCQCGALTGRVETRARAGHSLCYCKDCQAFIRFLGRDADLLDERGGCENIQTLPKDVTFLTGAQHIACMRLSATGMIRWYAACCNTPIGNTPATRKIAFVGLSRACLENASPSVEQSFGRVWHCTFVDGARGEPKPKPFGFAGLMLWLIGNQLRARFTGGIRENPFFVAGQDKPIVEPTILTEAESARLREVA